MDNNYDISTTISTGWIESLALEELQSSETGIIKLDDHLSPERDLRNSGIELMDRLRELFEIYLTKFNQIRVREENKNSLIKIFKIANTVNDFMLYRNSLKLVVARKASDVISIGFLSNTGCVFSARLNSFSDAEAGIHEIQAHVGPFNQIEWRFRGENFDLDRMVKHYLSEFVRHSQN